VRRHREPPSAALAASLAALLLAGCAGGGGLLATVGPNYAPPASPAAPASSAAWQAPLPDDNARLQALRAEWAANFGDAALLRLLDAAQAASADLPQAAARIAQARAALAGVQAAAEPDNLALAQASRSRIATGQAPPMDQMLQQSLGLALQSTWEIDLFGGLARQREAAQARLAGARAAWHDARITLAAQTALAYLDLRLQELQVELARLEFDSRSTSANIAEAAARAGLQPASAAALARAEQARAAEALWRERTRLDASIKALVSLTALDERSLRELLRPGRATLPRPARFAVDAVPAQALARRPDLIAAERELAAAAAQIGVAEAARWPRLALQGSLRPARNSNDGGPSFSVLPWSIGPSISLPLGASARREADVAAARAAYDAAEAGWRARVRQAAAEVEERLSALALLAERERAAQDQAQALKQALAAAEARAQAGLGTRLETEELRRAALTGDAGLAAVAHARVALWIGLYRALGGDWQGEAATPQAATPQAATPQAATPQAATPQAATPQAAAPR
jgi:NodT family efflux transporter outer membrane factor (OMF) lipoprotein